MLPLLKLTQEKTSHSTMALIIVLGLSFGPLVCIAGFSLIWLAGIVFVRAPLPRMPSQMKGSPWWSEARGLGHAGLRVGLAARDRRYRCGHDASLPPGEA